MSALDGFLSRLDRVKKTGPNRWVALCPAHEDRSPSLSVRELDDGRILVHCFADCGVEEILGAVGLDFDALFPEKPIEHEHGKRERRPFNAHDVLECLSEEARIAAIAAGDMVRGIQISEIDHARLLTAATRLESGRRLANGER